MPEITQEEFDRLKAADDERQRLAREKEEMAAAYSRDVGMLTQNIQTLTSSSQQAQEDEEDDDLFVRNPRQAVRQQANKVFAEQSAPTIKALNEAAISTRLASLVSSGELKQEWMKEAKDYLFKMSSQPNAAHEETIQNVVQFVKSKHVDDLVSERLNKRLAELEAERKAKAAEEEDVDEVVVGEPEREEAPPPPRRAVEAPTAGSSGVNPRQVVTAKERVRLTREQKDAQEFMDESSLYGGLTAEEYVKYSKQNYTENIYGIQGRR